jgi:hypothetical protein
MTVSFKGDSISIVHLKSPYYGVGSLAEMKVDGVVVENVSGYAAANQFQSVWTSPGMDPGVTHTLVVTIKGGYWGVDAVVVE